MSEVVRAASTAEAAQQWTLTRDQLTAVAKDGDLWFPSRG